MPLVVRYKREYILTIVKLRVTSVSEFSSPVLQIVIFYCLMGLTLKKKIHFHFETFKSGKAKFVNIEPVYTCLCGCRGQVSAPDPTSELATCQIHSLLAMPALNYEWQVPPLLT